MTGFEYPECRGHPDLSSLIAQAAYPPPCVSVVLVGVLTCMGDRDLRVRLKNPGARNEYLEVLNSLLRNEYLQVLIRRFLYLGWRCIIAPVFDVLGRLGWWRVIMPRCRQ